MTKVVFDNIIFSLQHTGGISHVWSELISHVAGRADCAFLEYAGAMSNCYRREIQLPPQAVVARRFPPPVAERMCRAGYRCAAPHVFHSSYYRLPAVGTAKVVTTVHDFIHERYYRGLKARMFGAMKRRAIMGADVVVCVSESTRRDLLHYVPEARGKRIEVVHNPVSEAFRPDAERLPELHDAVLFVGERAGYKNFGPAVDAVARAGMRLCVCGAPLSAAERRALDRELPGRWCVFEYPDSDLLNRIYNSVFALIYPSAYEGFGLPVAEARNAGCPVVAMRDSSIPEVSGDVFTLVDKADGFATMLGRLKDRAFREEAVAHGLESGPRFGAERFASAYLDIYESPER